MHTCISAFHIHRLNVSTFIHLSKCMTRVNLCAKQCHGAIISTLAQWPRLNPGFDPPPNLSLQARGWGWVLYSACQLDSVSFSPSRRPCRFNVSLFQPPTPTPHHWTEELAIEGSFGCLIQHRAELAPLIPVMISDFQILELFLSLLYQYLQKARKRKISKYFWFDWSLSLGAYTRWNRPKKIIIPLLV